MNFIEETKKITISVLEQFISLAGGSITKEELLTTPLGEIIEKLVPNGILLIPYYKELTKRINDNVRERIITP